MMNARDNQIVMPASNLPSGVGMQRWNRMRESVSGNYPSTRKVGARHFAGFLAASVALAVNLCANGAGQSAPPVAPQQAPASAQSPKLQVATRLVQVNVIVHDKNGNPVSGLTKNDFTIFDQGQPQTIAFMSEQTTKVASPALTAIAQPANLFSNRLQERYGVPPSVSVILVDGLNTPMRYLAFAKNQVLKFLAQVQPQDRVALYGLSNKIYVLHDFTTDTAALQKALVGISKLPQDQGNGTESMEDVVQTGMDPDFDAWAASVVQAIKDFDTVNRVEQTAYALEAIANHLASLPGRKNLIWISSSFPIQINMDSVGNLSGYGGNGSGPQSFADEVEKCARTLSNANVAIYPVDARGLVASRGGVMGPAPDVNVMNVLADRTGGRAFYNTNDIAGSIRRAVEDARTTYVLSYYPSHNEWDGRFREIKVKVDRSGVDVRSRRGYFAFPDTPVSAKDKEQIMVEAAKNPLESTELGLDVQASPVDVPGARQLRAKVTLDPAQLLLTRNGDRWSDSLEVKWVQLGEDGSVLISTSQTLNLNIPQEKYEDAMHRSLSFNGSVDLTNNTTEIRLIARDSGNGSIGTVNIPLRKMFASAGGQ